MLVLARKRLESVVIGETNNVERLIKVTVLEICGGKVRLGFDAAPNVRIFRSELLQKVPDSALPASEPENRLAHVES